MTKLKLILFGNNLKEKGGKLLAEELEKLDNLKKISLDLFSYF